MSLFKPAVSTSSYLKCMTFGAAGSGKTFTSIQIAIGLVKHMREHGLPRGDQPIYFLDTEKGSDWIAEMVREAGIEILVAKTRSFRDLCEALREAERNASVLLIDSLTHFWTELCDTYGEQRGRKRGLEMYDWGVVKKMWRDGFAEPYINSQCHIIVCGRAGSEYDQYEDDGGKKQIVKSGVKMKAEGEAAYEADLLIYMEREQSGERGERRVHHIAQVLKDRSTLIEGAAFVDPTFENFLPHISKLNLGGKQLGVDTTRTSAIMIEKEARRDQTRLERRIVLEEIEHLMLSQWPSTGAADKKAKSDALLHYFGTRSWTEVEERMDLFTVQASYDAMHREIVGGPSRYGVKAPSVEEKPAEGPVDEIPDFAEAKPVSVETTLPVTVHEWPAAAEATATVPDPREAHVDKLIAGLKVFAGNKTRLALQMKATEKHMPKFTGPQQGRIKSAYRDLCAGGPAINGSAH